MIAAAYTIGGLLAFLLLLSLALILASRRQLLDNPRRHITDPFHSRNVAGAGTSVIRKTGATYP